MPKKMTEQERARVVSTTRDVAEFTRRMGFAAEADAFLACAAQCEAEQMTFKAVRTVLKPPMDRTYPLIWRKCFPRINELAPGMEQSVKELHRVWLALKAALTADEVKPTVVKGLVPGDAVGTSIVGDVETGKGIANRSLELVERFSAAVIGKDVEAAYQMCANEFRNRRTPEGFWKEVPKVQGKNEGHPIRWKPSSVTWVYADEASRKESNKDGEWPAETPKPNKRAIVVGWWESRDKDGDEIGREVAFWVTEEEDGYRIAKISQYHS